MKLDSVCSLRNDMLLFNGILERKTEHEEYLFEGGELGKEYYINVFAVIKEYGSSVLEED